MNWALGYTLHESFPIPFYSVTAECNLDLDKLNSYGSAAHTDQDHS